MWRVMSRFLQRLSENFAVERRDAKIAMMAAAKDNVASAVNGLSAAGMDFVIGG